VDDSQKSIKKGEPNSPFNFLLLITLG